MKEEEDYEEDYIEGEKEYENDIDENTPTFRERASSAYHKMGDTIDKGAEAYHKVGDRIDRVRASDTYKGVVKAFAPRVVKRERAPSRSVSVKPRTTTRRVVVRNVAPPTHSTHRQLQPAVRIQTFGTGPMPTIGSGRMGSSRSPLVTNTFGGPMPRIGSVGSGKKIGQTSRPSGKRTQFNGAMPRMGSFGSGTSTMPRMGSIGSGFKLPNSLDLLKPKPVKKLVKKPVKRKTTKRKTIRRKRK